MWRFRKWLSKRREYRTWVRDNDTLGTLMKFNFPFRVDPLLLGEYLLEEDTWDYYIQ